MKFLRHIPWGGIGKTVSGAAQVVAGVAIFYVAPQHAELATGMIVSGLGLTAGGVLHKILKGIEAAAKADSGNRNGGWPK